MPDLRPPPLDAGSARRSSPCCSSAEQIWLVHLLEETARHAGHADILRELIDGSTGR